MKMKHLLTGLAAAVLGAASFATQADTLRFAHVYEVGHPLHKGAEMAAKLLKERTDGRYCCITFRIIEHHVSFLFVALSLLQRRS